MTIYIDYFLPTGKNAKIHTRLEAEGKTAEGALEVARLYAQEKHGKWFALVSIENIVKDRELFFLPPIEKGARRKWINTQQANSI